MTRALNFALIVTVEAGPDGAPLIVARGLDRPVAREALDHVLARFDEEGGPR